MKNYLYPIMVILAISACTSSPSQKKPMLLKANYVFNDDTENATYCVLKHFDETYRTLISKVDQTEHGWDIQLKDGQALLLVLSMMKQTNQKTVGALFLQADEVPNQRWIDRTSKAALVCHGRMTY